MNIRIKEATKDYLGRISLVRVSKKTGEPVSHVLSTHNVITYNGADVLAQLLAGNRNYAPSRVGYIYAPSGASMTDPGTDRDQTWDKIAQDVKTVTGNMVASRLGANPLISVDGPTDRYSGNAVTFNAISDATADLVFSGVGYASAAPAAGSDKYFQVVLLAEVYAAGAIAPTYVPYARAALGAGVDVATDTELAVYWNQVFK